MLLKGKEARKEGEKGEILNNGGKGRAKKENGQNRI